MKKLRWMLILSMVAVLVLSACGAQETAAPEEEALRVALVLDGKIDDMGWNQAGYEGLTQAEADHGVEVDYSEEVPIPDFEKALRDYATQGYDMIICHSSIAKDAVMNTANDYPEIAFLWTDGDETLDNLAVIRPLAQEASYLAGILAGEMTETNTVGMVGGIDIPSTHRSFAAFELGLKEANPEAELLVNWIGSFLDVSAGKEAALSQIEAGADLIFGNGDGQNIGVLQAASEEEVLAIGAVRDQYEVAPNVVLTSVEWGFRDGISRVVGDFVAGDFEGRVYEISLEEGADLSPYHDNADLIPADVKEKIEETRQAILDGELEVPNIPFEE
jgi:basic membrane protein A